MSDSRKSLSCYSHLKKIPDVTEQARTRSPDWRHPEEEVHGAPAEEVAVHAEPGPPHSPSQDIPGRHGPGPQGELDHHGYISYKIGPYKHN